MTPIDFIKKIKNYAIASFLIPLIAINSCLLIYKFLGDKALWPNFPYDKEKFEHTFIEHRTKLKNFETWTFTNCPKYLHKERFITIDNQTMENNFENKDIYLDLKRNNKIKNIISEQGKNLNDKCVKNYQLTYLLLKKFSSLETILINAVQKNPVGFVKIKNPYFYGEVSISRTARYYPSKLIFKTLIILSALLLFLYWKNNLNLFNELKNRNILVNSSKKFYYLGILSCIFLTLHAAFLGLDFDSKLFAAIRKLIIILFIFFEISAQIFLTKNLFKFREELKKYINLLILNIKIIFVIIVFFATCVAFAILVFGDPSTAFKHSLEWNYFAFLLLYYLLSRLLWR